MKPQKDPPLVMIVEDFLQNLQILGKNLEMAGYDIVLCSSGETSIEMLKNIQPDLILMDVMMPGMNGYETCEEIKKNTHTRDIPIIFLTAKSEHEDIIQGFQSGGIDFILKPFNSTELIAKVKLHIEVKSIKERLNKVKKTSKNLKSSVSKIAKNIETSKDKHTLLAYTKKTAQAIDDLLELTH